MDERFQLLRGQGAQTALRLGLFGLMGHDLFRLANARLSSCSIALTRSPAAAALDST